MGETHSIEIFTDTLHECVKMCQEWQYANGVIKNIYFLQNDMTNVDNFFLGS